MRSLVITSILAGALLASAAKIIADPELVIAIRYLQAEGTSHAHLYLYREDGKLLRQLTNDNSGQDVDPIFAPDGGTIVFTRKMPNNSLEFWSIDPLGASSKKLGAAPEWYTKTKSSPYFTNRGEEKPEGSPTGRHSDEGGRRAELQFPRWLDRACSQDCARG
jgi:Tol biopolymer transport system component